MQERSFFTEPSALVSQGNLAVLIRRKGRGERREDRGERRETRGDMRHET